MNTINIRPEYTLMNVEVSEDFRHFGGKLDLRDNQEISRVFAVLIDENTRKQLENMGFDYSIIRVRNSEVDRSFRYSLMIRVDYGICKPNIEVITEAKTICLDETKLGCLDSLDIDFANLTVVQSGIYNEKGKKLWSQAILKDMKAYSL